MHRRLVMAPDNLDRVQRGVVRERLLVRELFARCLSVCGSLFHWSPLDDDAGETQGLLNTLSQLWKPNRESIARVLESAQFHPLCMEKVIEMKELAQHLRWQVDDLHRRLQM
jgi:hypothetical protein